MWTVGRCRTTRLLNFLGWTDFLSYEATLARVELRYKRLTEMSAFKSRVYLSHYALMISERAVQLTLWMSVGSFVFWKSTSSLAIKTRLLETYVEIVLHSRCTVSPNVLIEDTILLICFLVETGQLFVRGHELSDSVAVGRAGATSTFISQLFQNPGYYSRPWKWARDLPLCNQALYPTELILPRYKHGCFRFFPRYITKREISSYFAFYF